ncbi:MAG TPA: hypothetical protein VL068_11475 [Microthrixaceae bacterium]|nr:hypothetical protein [Microthrixaceae bacterium]
MLIDRVGQHGNPSGQHGKPAGWVVSGLLGEYQVEVGVGNRSVSEAPEDSGLGTASWSFALNGQGELLTRSFVVDGIAGTTSSMIADLPAEILLSPQDGTSPDGSSVPNGFSDEDCGTAVAAMAPVDLTVAVAGPDIQYAAQVALRVGNVLAGLE